MMHRRATLVSYGFPVGRYSFIFFWEMNEVLSALLYTQPGADKKRKRWNIFIKVFTYRNDKKVCFNIIPVLMISFVFIEPLSVQVKSECPHHKWPIVLLRNNTLCHRFVQPNTGPKYLLHNINVSPPYYPVFPMWAFGYCLFDIPFLDCVCSPSVCNGGPPQLCSKPAYVLWEHKGWFVIPSIQYSYS